MARQFDPINCTILDLEPLNCEESMTNPSTSFLVLFWLIFLCRALTARRLFGLGTSELLVVVASETAPLTGRNRLRRAANLAKILGAAILFFGPDALKSVAKEAGKAGMNGI